MNKQKPILLHGAIGSASQLEPIAEKLKDNFQIHTLNFSGHGGLPIPTEPFSIKLFALDVINYLVKNNLVPQTFLSVDNSALLSNVPKGYRASSAMSVGEGLGERQNKISIFGYSMGGYVALYLAKHYPHLVNKVFTIATKFNWSPEIAAKETAMLNPEKILEKIHGFAKELSKRHLLLPEGECRHPLCRAQGEGVGATPLSIEDGEGLGEGQNNWKSVLSKTAEMMTNLGNHTELTYEEMKTITCPVIVSVGDSDKMVSIEETTLAHRSIPNSKLVILPNTPHPIEKIPLDVLIRYINTEMEPAMSGYNSASD